MIRLHYILCIPIVILAFSSCKKGTGHAKEGEDAKLLQLGPEEPEDTVADLPAPLKEPVSIVPPKVTIPEDPMRPLVPPPPVADTPPEDAEPIEPSFPMLAIIPASTQSTTDYKSGEKRLLDVQQRSHTPLTQALQPKGLFLGDPIFIRVLKEERLVELFIKHRTTKKFTLAHSYRIAAMSGTLGPKLSEGDFQAPEGCYYVPLRRFHPSSKYHLAFNIGYPNKYDKAHDRSGSAIMMHGAEASVGCYAMTDQGIEEIYTIAHAALTSGKQKYFRFHSFPFRMTDENMEKYKDNQWIDFWKNLKTGYDHFESTGTPPSVTVSNKRYQFQPQ